MRLEMEDGHSIGCPIGLFQAQPLVKETETVADAKARVLIQRLLEELEHATDSEYQAGLKNLARKYLGQPTSEENFDG